MPRLRFFLTLPQVKKRPFIAMYTPWGKHCAREIALPRLNSPSDEWNA
jgi:hypothetical protein